MSKNEVAKVLRKSEIKRNVLIVVSYINIFLGMANLLIAFWYNHNGVPNDEANVAIYAINGILVSLVGMGGVYYEQILREREESFRRNVHIVSQNNS